MTETRFRYLKEFGDLGNTYTPYEAYEYVIDNALKVPCDITDSALDFLHNETLKTIEAECDFKELGGLRYRAETYIAKTKQRAKERKYTSKETKMENGLHTSLNDPFCRKFVFKNTQNLPESVFDEIKEWIGQDEKLITVYKERRKELESNYQFSVIQNTLSKGLYVLGKQEYPGYTKSYFDMPPVEVTVHLHDPESIEVVGDIQFEQNSLNLQVGSKMVSFLTIHQKQKCRFSCRANVVQKWRKGHYRRLWEKILSFGISAAFDDKSLTVQNFHFPEIITAYAPLSIDVDTFFQFRSKPTISISESEASAYLEKAKKFEEFAEAISGKSQAQDMIAPPQVHFKHDAQYKKYPWLELIDVMRQCGTRVAVEIADSKPEVILSAKYLKIGDFNGIEPLEFEIVKTLANSAERENPLKLIAGDGHGSFVLHGCDMVEIDAVFENTDGNRFAVCFKKCSDITVCSLIDNMLANKAANHTKGHIIHMLAEAANDIKTIEMAYHMRPANVDRMGQFLESSKTSISKLFSDDAIIKCLHQLQVCTNELRERKEFPCEKSLYMRVDGAALDLYLQISNSNVFEKEFLEQLGTNTMVATAIDGIITMLCDYETRLKDFIGGGIEANELAVFILEYTGERVIWGGTIGTSFSPAEMLASFATVVGWRAYALFVTGYEYYTKRNTYYNGTDTVNLLAYAATVYPLLRHIEMLRECRTCILKGESKALTELLLKKQQIIQAEGNTSGEWLNPSDEKMLCGIVFEELQIAKVMSKAIEKGVPLELIAGDGRGRFTYNGQELTTPEYVDAVFRNTATDEYFAVQFKFSDKPEYLVEMINRHNEKWTGNHNATIEHINETYPEAMKFKNVHIVGPNDVVGGIEGENRQLFEERIRTGFSTRPDNVEATKNMLYENRELLQEAANSSFLTDIADCRRRKDNINTELDRERKKIYKHEQREIPSNEKQREFHLQKTEMLTEKVKQLEENLLNEEKALADLEEGLKDYLCEKKNQHIEKPTALRKTVIKYGSALALGTAIDGVVTFVSAMHEEVIKYRDGKISVTQLLKNVFAETGKAIGKGAGINLGILLAEDTSVWISKQFFTEATAETIGKGVGALAIAGILCYQTYSILNEWHNGNITTAQMEKGLIRTGVGAAVGMGGMIAAASLIGGPIGFLVGAGIAIAWGIFDHFLGDKILSLFIKEDPEELKKIVLKNYESLKQDVTKAAYGIFSLSEYSTDEELREAYRAALLKYHPDKGGNSHKFQAVHSAFATLVVFRNNSTF